MNENVMVVGEELHDLTLTERLDQVVNSNSQILKRLGELGDILDIKINGDRPVAGSVGDDKDCREMSLSKLMTNIEDQVSVMFSYVDEIDSSIAKL